MRIQPFKPFPHHIEGLDIHRYIYRAGRRAAGIGVSAAAVTAPGRERRAAGIGAGAVLGCQ